MKGQNDKKVQNDKKRLRMTEKGVRKEGILRSVALPQNNKEGADDVLSRSPELMRRVSEGMTK